MEIKKLQFCKGSGQYKHIILHQNTQRHQQVMKSIKRWEYKVDKGMQNVSDDKPPDQKHLMQHHLQLHPAVVCIHLG